MSCHRSARLHAAGRRWLGAGLLTALLLGLGGCDGGGHDDVAEGLRFDVIPPVADALVAPLERYPTRNGSTLPVRHYPARSDKVLILLHGSSYHSRYLAPLAARLAETGRAAVFTPDLRGHGLSPERRGDIDYVDQLEDDVADLVAFARERYPDAKIVVGGHSSGGGLAVRFAGSRHGHLAAGFLLLAPYLGHDAPTTRPGSGGWAHANVPRIVAIGLLERLGIHAFGGVITLTFEKPEALRDGTETLAYSYRLMTGYAPRRYTTDLAAIHGPLLALIGSEDEAFLPEKLAPTIAACTEGDVAVLPGVAHLDLPAAPETARRVEAWLATF